jgi:uncharacterized protein (TIGR03067 family)
MAMCMLLAMTLGLVSGSDNATKNESARAAGVWRFVLVQVDGKKQPALPFGTNKMIISKDGSYTVIQGRNVTRGTLKVDPNGLPKHYDVTLTTGPLKGTSFLGIYDLQGDALKVCFSLKGKERPATLGSESGSGLLYEVFAREKQDIDEALREAARIEREAAGKGAGTGDK